MDLVKIDRGAGLAGVYDEVLRPAFPPSELVDLADLGRGIDTGQTEVWAALDDDGRRVGAVVGDWFASCRVMLLSYLAVVGTGRGSGVGSYLFDGVIRQWSTRYQPCAVLAEVEHPARHQSSAEHGDPVARLRFYGRHGARALRLPYFQPSLAGPGGRRVYGMLLLGLHVDPTLQGSGGEYTVHSDVLRTFLTDYFLADEGGLPEDAAGRALWAALAAPGGVPTSPVTEIDDIPIADPPAQRS